MDKIRVLQVSNQLGLGGTDKTLEVLSRKLNRDFFDVFVVGIQAGGPREHSLRAAGIPTCVAHGDLQAVRRIVETDNIDVVNLHHVSVPQELLLNKHIVLTHHFSKRLYPLKAELGVSKLLFNSTRTLQKYMAAYGLKVIPKNANILLNPVDLDEIEHLQQSITPADLRAYRTSLGIAEGDFVMGRFGRGDVVKWSDALLEAVRAMKRRGVAVKLLVQTAPPSRAKAMIREFGTSVVILPETSSRRDLALFFSVIDVYAHASRIGESFGVSIAEAMAFKKPVVVTSTPRADNAQIELVDNGRTGFVVSYPETFAQAMTLLKEKPALRRHMGELGFQKVRSTCSADLVTSQYERMLIDLSHRGDQASEYARTLTPPMTLSEMRTAFDEYDQRLSRTFGTMSGKDLLRYWSGQPARIRQRLVDYLDFRRRIN